MSLKENFERKNKDLVSEIQKLKNEKKLKSETEAELLSIIQMFEDNLRQKEKELTEKFENEKSDLIEEINRLQNIIKELENNNLQSNPSNQSLLEIDHELIEKGKIGEGAYGIIFGGKYKINNTLLTLKQSNVIPKTSSKTKENFKKELMFIDMSNHPNITVLIGISKLKEGNDIMILEYLIKSSLYHQLHEKNIKLPIWLQIKLSIDIMKGILYLHQSNPKLIYRNLNSHNVLLDSEWNGKLSDFGLTKLETETITGITGTSNWMAPEILEEGKINEKVDIYSFGMILYEMSTNLIPFKGLNRFQIIAHLLKNKKPIIPNSYPPKLKAIINTCWEENPSLRPSSIQILGKLELLLLDTEFRSIKEELISSEWDFTLDFLNQNTWKNNFNYETFKLFEINVKSLTYSSSFNYAINLEYSLNHTIEYCEWNRIENIIKREYYSPSILYDRNSLIRINSFYAIQNENLNQKFKSNIIHCGNKIENNPKLFGIKTWEGDLNEKWRDWILDQFKTISNQFPNKNGLNNEIKIIPLFYFLKNEELGWKICSQGFNSSFFDRGWMGKGIYFSSNLEYLLNPNIHQELEIDSNGEYSILLSYVLIDSVYPYIENFIKEKSAKLGHSCHFSLVKTESSFSSTVCKEDETQQELKKSLPQFVIFNPDYILPKYILKLRIHKE